MTMVLFVFDSLIPSMLSVHVFPQILVLLESDIEWIPRLLSRQAFPFTEQPFTILMCIPISIRISPVHINTAIRISYTPVLTNTVVIPIFFEYPMYIAGVATILRNQVIITRIDLYAAVISIAAVF